MLRQDFALQQPVLGQENTTKPIELPLAKSKKAGSARNAAKTLAKTEATKLLNVHDPLDGNFLNRFDYFVRTRPAKEEDVANTKDNSDVEYPKIIRHVLEYLDEVDAAANSTW